MQKKKTATRILMSLKLRLLSATCQLLVPTVHAAEPEISYNKLDPLILLSSLV